MKPFLIGIIALLVIIGIAFPFVDKKLRKKRQSKEATKQVAKAFENALITYQD